MRIALGIEYDGFAYNGWQKQDTGIGIQSLVEEALSTVANHNVDSVCAGRTDAGVHAAGQVVHCDVQSKRSMRSWLLGINSNLPDDINVCWVKRVHDDFHARYSAISRTYAYLIINKSVRSSLFRRRAWWINSPLDHNLMITGGKHLLGDHDFSAFRAAGCQASSPVRDLQEIQIKRKSDWIIITIKANAFLQRMVRNIVGVLVMIGSQEKPTDWSLEVLRSCNREKGGISAPAHGLTLIQIDYQEELPINKISYFSFF